MILLHVTPEENVPSILTTGIDPARSTGAYRWSWFATPKAKRWAVGHVRKRHNVQKGRTAVIRVALPDNWIVRQRNTVYICDRTTPVANILSIEYI